MCLNTTEADNNLYYGKAFITGTVNIFGFMDNILISAKSAKRTGAQAASVVRSRLCEKADVRHISLKADL